MTAEGPLKPIPKGAYGDSVRIEVLLHKFLFHQPTARHLNHLDLLGLDYQGAVTDGLKRMMPLFETVYDQMVIHSQNACHWNGDETRRFVSTPKAK